MPTINAPFVVLQAVSPYMSFNSELRISRHVPDPATNNFSDVFTSADWIAITTLLANKTFEHPTIHRLEYVRNVVFHDIVELAGVHVAHGRCRCARASLPFPILDILKMVLVLTRGLLKNVTYSFTCLLVDQLISTACGA